MTRPSLASRVSAFLDEEHVAFALVGATALGVRGFVRGTHDLDFMTLDGRVFDLDWTSALAGAATVQLLRGDFDDPLRGTPCASNLMTTGNLAASRVVSMRT